MKNHHPTHGAGLILNKPAKDFVKLIAQHFFGNKEQPRKVPV